MNERRLAAFIEAAVRRRPNAIRTTRQSRLNGNPAPKASERNVVRARKSSRRGLWADEIVFCARRPAGALATWRGTPGGTPKWQLDYFRENSQTSLKPRSSLKPIANAFTFTLPEPEMQSEMRWLPDELQTRGRGAVVFYGHQPWCRRHVVG